MPRERGKCLVLASYLVFVCSARPAYRLEDTFGPDPTMIRANCLVQTTEWSACSKTCGMGISTRVTNDNAFCRLEKQSRLCMVRPCEVDLEENIKVPVLLLLTNFHGVIVARTNVRSPTTLVIIGLLYFKNIITIVLFCWNEMLCNRNHQLSTLKSSTVVVNSRHPKRGYAYFWKTGKRGSNFLSSKYKQKSDTVSLEHTEVGESHSPWRVTDLSLLPCLP